MLLACVGELVKCINLPRNASSIKTVLKRVSPFQKLLKSPSELYAELNPG